MSIIGFYVDKQSKTLTILWGDIMIKEERYDKILQILEEENYISAQTLAQKLYVSLPTIRRDLAYLHRRNLIIRSHGGAKKINSEHILLPLAFRKSINQPVKRKLCREAAKLVKDNDIVFIDASTTAVQMADFLSPKSGVTVITNSIPLSISLSKKGIKVYCTGGELQENSLCYAGSFAEDFIRTFNIDIMFFSSSGINKNGMITDVSLPETLFRKVAAKIADKTVFLCDSTKFAISAPYNLMSLEDVDYVITDSIDKSFFCDGVNCTVITAD